MADGREAFESAWSSRLTMGKGVCLFWEAYREDVTSLIFETLGLGKPLSQVKLYSLNSRIQFVGHKIGDMCLRGRMEI